MTEESKKIHPAQIITEAFRLWGNNIWAFFLVSAITSLPITLMQSAMALIKARPILTNIILVMFGFVFSMAISFFGSIAMILMVSGAKNNAQFGPLKSLAAAKPYFWKFVTAALASNVFLIMIAMVGIGGINIIAPLLWKTNIILSVLVSSVLGIAALCFLVYFMIRLSLGYFVSVTENKWPIAAMQRSHRLVNGYVNRVVGVYAIFCLLALVAVLPPLLLQVNPESIAFRAYQFLTSCLVNPLGVVIVTIMYYALREVVDTDVRA